MPRLIHNLILAAATVVGVAEAKTNILTAIVETVLQRQKVESVPQCGPLYDLYMNTNGAEWKNNDGWFMRTTCCSWHGIYCSHRGDIEAIILDNNNLTGDFPSEAVKNIDTLEYLNIGNNNLTGDLAPLSDMDLLTINAEGNNFDGAVPESLFHMKKLYLLNLSNNKYNSLPQEVDPNVSTVMLKNNNFHCPNPRWAVDKGFIDEADCE
eukprot:GFYU01011389.1.p1 GENE.GFYU01011389.1~~GFYU01011389.1.p1  ORF type:complete len:217 (-),score=33.92 GFYU01011389.1:130-756(-)